MTTPDRSSFGDAPEADVVEQLTPVADVDEETWPDAQRVGADRDWQATEADLIEQSIPVPEDETEFDR
ncbi:hypothetical protein [Mycobacterium sp. NAZ190054]|uniref:hypothetical protein n=1 Tax=Mycobacterium sp. NAZ190054 TaxID=1747766 RepID=UPI00079498BE|nr:hypothetical protein [Mycobacterium sp. NAZ190054]KWX66583.1 hypothetical protein ASJ79_24885 [Mycobacterium sp. NAZ190054]